MRPSAAGAKDVAFDRGSGLMLSTHRLGHGRFVLNTLRIIENLGTHPAAERIPRSILRRAARDAGKPLLELPADFETRLEAPGTKE